MERIFRNQPSVEELKQDTIFVRFVVNNEIPKKGTLLRMTYYTELASRPEEIYYLQSYRRPTDKDAIERMKQEEQIIELPEKIILPWENDVWVDHEGNLFLAKGYAPWEDKENMKSFFNILKT